MGVGLLAYIRAASTIAIVGSLDAASIRGIAELYWMYTATTKIIAPRSLLTAIAIRSKDNRHYHCNQINCRRFDPRAHTLTYEDYLKNTVYVERLTSAETSSRGLPGSKDQRRDKRRIKTANSGDRGYSAQGVRQLEDRLH